MNGIKLSADYNANGRGENIEIAEYLLDKGWQIDLKDKDGQNRVALGSFSFLAISPTGNDSIETNYLLAPKLYDFLATATSVKHTDCYNHLVE
jgi:hypothetical protein